MIQLSRLLGMSNKFYILMKKFLLIAVIILIILVSGILVFKSGKQLTLDPRSQLASVSGSGSGLVAHYTFDDGTAKDVAGGNNGTVPGATDVVGRRSWAVSVYLRWVRC